MLRCSADLATATDGLRATEGLGNLMHSFDDTHTHTHTHVCCRILQLLVPAPQSSHPQMGGKLAGLALLASKLMTCFALLVLADLAFPLFSRLPVFHAFCCEVLLPRQGRIWFLRLRCRLAPNIANHPQYSDIFFVGKTQEPPTLGFVCLTSLKVEAWTQQRSARQSMW